MRNKRVVFGCFKKNTRLKAVYFKQTPMKNKLFQIFCLLLLPYLMIGQNINIEYVENKVVQLVKKKEAEKSIIYLNEILNSNKLSDFELISLYIIKSKVSKTRSDYEEVIISLNTADEILKKTKDKLTKTTFQNEVISQLAFAYFDIQNFKKADSLGRIVKKNNYQFLNKRTIAYLYMQDGYFDMQNKKYQSASEHYDLAYNLVGEENKPVIMGKKIELMFLQNLDKKAIQLFNDGIRISRESKNLKYELYLNEVMKKVYGDRKDNKNFIKYSIRVDSLNKIFNPYRYKAKISNLEKKQMGISKSKNNTSLLITIGVAISIFFVITTIYYKKFKNSIDKVDKSLTMIHDDNKIQLNGKHENETSTALSFKQKQIIKLIREGKSNKEIAQELKITENTVKHHLKIIFKHFKINKRKELLGIPESEI